jgi:iron complex transport system ATP-binding protein
VPALENNSQACKVEQLLNVDSLCWSVDERLILEKLSFKINKGEFVGVIGPNGAGKSSLLRCIYRKIAPNSGNIYFNNKAIEDYSRSSLAQKIAVVLQEPPTQFDLTVMDVVRMGLIPNKPLLSFDTEQDVKNIMSAVEKVDLLGKLQQAFNSLSGGEKQRAMIARAILQSPELLLMDEPTNHLDIRHQIEVLELAKTMGITVMVSIHDLNLAATFCDRLILINEGKIVAQGKPEAVLTESILKQVFSVNTYIDQHPFTQKLRITFDLSSIKESYGANDA